MAISQNYVYLIKYLAVLSFTFGVLAKTGFENAVPAINLLAGDTHSDEVSPRSQRMEKRDQKVIKFVTSWKNHTNKAPGRYSITFTNRREVNSSCLLPDKTLGKCVRATECPEVACGYIYGVNGTYCGDNENVICCNQTTSLSQRACSRYDDYRVQRSIKGGEDIEPADYPYLALLGFVKRLSTGEISNVAWICTGVLISEKYVLTAAHCSTNPLNGQLTKVKLGSQNEDENIFNVEDIIPHDSFRPPAKYGDIALIKLVRSVNICKKLWPPCIGNVRKEEVMGKELTVLGWESPYDVDVEPNTNPQKAGLMMMTNDECQTYLGIDTIIQLPKNLSESMFCAKNQTSDTCRGDSGGPILMEDDAHHILVGITSFGYDPCVGRPSVYTNVSYYRNWIECIVWPNEHIISQSKELTLNKV